MQNLLAEYQYRYLGLRGGWFLVYYIRSERHDPNTFSGRLLRFKERHAGVVNQWCRWACEELSKQGISYNYIVRALGSGETTPSGQKSLDDLGTAIANSLGSVYAPQILGKSRPTKPMHSLKLQQRKDEMRGIYQIASKRADLNHKNILIIDDITTTNTTIEEILRAMRESWPFARYYFFCLGRTHDIIGANNSITSRYFI